MRFFTDGNLCVGLLVAGGFILITMHMTMVWYLARGAGISALSNAIDVHQSALISGDGDSRSTEGPKAWRPKATEQTRESCSSLKRTTSSER